MTKKNSVALLCGSLLLGIVLLLTFVKLSQSYLSEYLVENSKSFLGQKLDLASVSEHLGDDRLAEYAKNPTEAPVLLVFWSSTCVPCLQELPQLEKNNPGALVIPINTDPPEMLEEAQQSAKLLAPQYPFRHDGEQFLQKAMKITYMPTEVTVDSKGFIKKFHVGKR